MKSHELMQHIINIKCALNKINIIISSEHYYQHITPQYAPDWEVIGTLLDLPSGETESYRGWILYQCQMVL